MVGDTLNKFQGLPVWGYRGYGCSDTGDTAGNTYYRVDWVIDVVIQVIQLAIHPTSYRGYSQGNTGDTKLQ